VTQVLVDPRSAQDIDERIARIHKDLDYRGGAIELAEVRALLKLDREFYSADESGVLGEVVHKLRIGAKQVLHRPGLLLDAVRNFDLRALFVPDRKQILISSTVPDLKVRWSEGHEIAHSLIPWHAEYLLGDTQATLLPSCHETIEAEANYGAGRLLFPVVDFLPRYRASLPNLKHVMALAKHFNNTITSTLWRCVESDAGPCFGVIGEHPRFPRDGKPAVEHLIRSPSFVWQFGTFGEAGVMPLLTSYCSYARRGPLGSGEILVRDARGAEHRFLAESFSHAHHTLSLARYLGPRLVAVAVLA
jgi:hypothetical protein